MPDGSVNLVNMAALPTRDGGYLIEDGPTLHMLTTERELLRTRVSPLRASRGLLAVGAPDYNRRVLPSGEDRGDGRTITRSAGCAAPASRVLWPLPGAAREVQEIAALWGNDRGEAQNPHRS